MAASRSMYWRSWSIAGSNRNRLARVRLERDTEKLNLLAIFNYVVAGLSQQFHFLQSHCFILLSPAWPRVSPFSRYFYTAVGVIFIFATRHGTAKPGEELPPEFL